MIFITKISLLHVSAKYVFSPISDTQVRNWKVRKQNWEKSTKFL